MTQIKRTAAREVRRRLRDYPVVALVGPRQVGKTTLAAQVSATFANDQTTRFDLEDPADLARLDDPMRGLKGLRGLVVLDEVQRLPDIFTTLRVLADRRGRPARFLVLGSASPDLLRQTAESLAGRVSYVELSGFGLEEVGQNRLARLWLRGGFPRSYLASSNQRSMQWRHDFVRTFLERDLPQLGLRVSRTTLQRFWSMLSPQPGRRPPHSVCTALVQRPEIQSEFLGRCA